MATFAIESPTFQPAMRIVTDITRANPATVTTSFDHDYITGEIVRLYVSKDFGMLQANNLYAKIVVTGTDTFTIDLDTTKFDLFVNAVGSSQRAQVVPMGEVNSILTAATRNVLPTGVR